MPQPGIALWAISFIAILSDCRRAQAGDKESATFRLGTLLPEAAPIMRTSRQAFREIEERSNGKVHFVVYAGGVLGDEMTMVRKMRLGQLDAVATSGALAAFVPEMSVLYLPFLFHSYAEVDALREHLMDQFAPAVEKRGAVLLTLADTGGFTQLFSSDPVREVGDLASRKVWVWSGIPTSVTFLPSFNAKTVPLEAPDVLPGFQTAMLDTLFANPLPIVLFQIHKHVRYMTQLNFSYLPVGILVDTGKWERFPPEVRAAFEEVFEKYTPVLVQQARRDDDTCLRAMVKAGMEILKPTPDELRGWRGVGETVWKRHANALYPEALLAEILGRLEQFRTSTN